MKNRKQGWEGIPFGLLLPRPNLCSIGLRRDGRFAEGVLVRLMAFREVGFDRA